MRIAPIFIILILASMIISQSRLDYFPYKTGNIWKYICFSEGSGWQHVQSTVVFDSTDSSGAIYLTKKSQCLDQGGSPPGYSNLYPTCKYVIIDSNYVYSEHENFITSGDSNGYYLKYKLDALLGESWIVDQDSIASNMYNYIVGKITDVDSTNLFGNPVISKEITYYVTHDTSDTSTYYNFILEKMVSYFGIGYYWYYPSTWTGYELLGAVIDGQANGDTTGLITNLNYNDISLEAFQLYQNYPNPLNSETNIEFDIKRAGQVEINIYDISGKLVKELLNENCLPGMHHIIWDGDDNQNKLVASGIYYLRLITGAHQAIKPMLLIK